MDIVVVCHIGSWCHFMQLQLSNSSLSTFSGRRTKSVVLVLLPRQRDVLDVQIVMSEKKIAHNLRPKIFWTEKLLPESPCNVTFFVHAFFSLRPELSGKTYT